MKSVFVLVYVLEGVCMLVRVCDFGQILYSIFVVLNFGDTPFNLFSKRNESARYVVYASFLYRTHIVLM